MRTRARLQENKKRARVLSSKLQTQSPIERIKREKKINYLRSSASRMSRLKAAISEKRSCRSCSRSAFVIGALDSSAAPSSVSTPAATEPPLIESLQAKQTIHIEIRPALTHFFVTLGDSVAAPPAAKAAPLTRPLAWPLLFAQLPPLSETFDVFCHGLGAPVEACEGNGGGGGGGIGAFRLSSDSFEAVECVDDVEAIDCTETTSA